MMSKGLLSVIAIVARPWLGLGYATPSSAANTWPLVVATGPDPS